MAVPFIALSIKKKDIKYALPGLLSIGGGKGYASSIFFQRLHEEGVDDYWKKSKKLDSDLRRVKHVIEKLNEKKAKEEL